MENCENLKEALKNLEGKTFRFHDKGAYRFTVTRVDYAMGKFYVYTSIQTFVKTETEFKAFLDIITITDDGEPTKKPFMPNKDKITPNKETMEASLIIQEQGAAINATLANATTMSNALMAQFNVLSGNPKPEDYKKAEAMAKLANTVTSVTQTQINLLNLKIKRS
jgi:hypothetical protein